jgi:hypothetical protein
MLPRLWQQHEHDVMGYPTTQYIVESRGDFVHRFIELPDGARISLRKRKSLRVRLYRAGDSNRQIWKTTR